MENAAIVRMLPAIALGLIFVFAIWHDVRSRRIPNQIIVAGTIAALLLQALMPAGAGLFSAPVGSAGMLFSLSGIAVGLLLLLPFYALHTMGAGDVKLMAVVGAFLGPFGVMGATLLTMLAGGVLALVVAFSTGQLLQVIVNIQQMLHTARSDRRAGAGVRLKPPVVVTGKLPYAIAIAAGTVGQLMLAGAAEWRLFS
ncbi:MAG: prepilin peptidase [Pseudomonadota bacterium]